MVLVIYTNMSIIGGGGADITGNGIIQCITSTSTDDIQIPLAPTILNSSNVTATSASIGFTPPTGSQVVTGYYVYNNGVLIGTFVGTGGTTNLTGLVMQTSYAITISAYNSYGISNASNSVSFTTPAITMNKITASTTRTITGARQIYYIIIGGGGAGGTSLSAIPCAGQGGGGAGGLVSGVITQLIDTTYTITVGSGGASTSAAGTVSKGGSGGYSSISYASTVITASGGYGGGDISGNYPGNTGGIIKGLSNIPGITESGINTIGGFAGNKQFNSLLTNVPYNTTGMPVRDISGYTITVSTTGGVVTDYYAGGGGGGDNNYDLPATIVSGQTYGTYGGGKGGSSGFMQAGAAKANSGGGGGGNRGNPNNSGAVGGNGGSGIIILMY